MKLGRILSLLEVLGVFIAGQYLSAIFASALGIAAESPLVRINSQITGAELLYASRDVFVYLLLQYSGWIALAAPLLWWHRRREHAAHETSRPQVPFRALIVGGVVTAGLSGWLLVGLPLLSGGYRASQLPWERAIAEMSWRRWQFWLFTAILGWGIAVLLDVIFIRCYCQRRLARDWGDGPAIVGVAALSTFSRLGLWNLDAYAASELLGLFLFAIGIGIAFAWSRSLVPCAVAQALGNLPLTPLWRVLLLAVLLAAAVWGRRSAFAVLRGAFTGSSIMLCLLLAAFCGGYVALLQGQAYGVYLAASILALSVAFQAMRTTGDDPSASMRL